MDSESNSKSEPNQTIVGNVESIKNPSTKENNGNSDVISKETNISNSTTGNTSNTSISNENKPGLMNNIKLTLGNFFLSIFINLFDYFKSNWLLFLILGILIVIFYVLYSNALNFMNMISDIFTNLKPLLTSTVDLLDTTIPSDSSSNLISSLTHDTSSTSDNLSNTLEDNLKPSNKNNNQEGEEGEEDEENEEGEEDEDTNNNEKTSEGNNLFDINNLSTTENNHKKGYEGYCFIGTGRNGVRTCAPISKNNKCISGDIFPRLDICVDPSLRE